ncbi:MAG TPA: hypothetical protein DCS29_00825 [Candidatus Magasanikbacteria bacterium]|nr:MAG: hypothetical protein A2479_03125 [Candidatus Magasanikbacteria bacterium RIFOXYC2_FULL_39_8]HAT03306.1 hypothetical protein [Candidatus Magasanikbacteria bacterium]
MFKKIHAYIFLILIIISAYFPFPAMAKIPNDPYALQWAYNDLGIYDAWDKTTGSKDVVVAVIDNGFDMFHPDLRDNVWKNESEIPDNKLDDDHNGYVDDVYGWNFLDYTNDPRPDVLGLDAASQEEGIYNHGTIVAGIIGAKGNNGRDGAGVNWDVKLMNLKVLGNDGVGDLAPLAEAIYYAVDNGADVINVSMVGSGEVDDVIEAVTYAYDHGVFVAAAAGNNLTYLNESPRYPICADNDTTIEKVVGVSAIDEGHHLAIFSNSGSQCIDITAPGVGIKSTLFFSPLDALYDTYSVDEGWDGTSFATPFLSGAAALIKSLQPLWKAPELIRALTSTVQHTPGQDEVVYANLFGAGLLQIDKAIEYALGQQTDSQKQDRSKQVVGPSLPASGESQSRMIFLAPLTGEYERRTHGNEMTDIVRRIAFEGVEDIERFVTRDGLVRYVTIRSGAPHEKIVSIYNHELGRLHKWSIEGDGIYDITAGDVLGDYESEVLISPKQASETYVSVYTLDGQSLRSIEDTSHDGASVNVIYDEVRDIYDVVLTYIYDGSTFVERIEGSSFDTIDVYSIDGVKGDRIIVGDIDNDGIDEYIVNSRVGKQARAYIIEQSGEVVRDFRVYLPQYKEGVFMNIFDYDDNGTYELIVTPQVNGQPVRVFDTYGRLIEEWWALNSKDRGPILVTQL